MSSVIKQSYKDADGYTYIAPRIAMEEAARCLLCHDAPCSKSCPAGTDPARFIRSIRFRNVKGAAEIIRENNPLGGICARVCPYEKFCQEACSRCGIDRPIRIGMLQQYAIQQEKVYGMQVLQAPMEKKNKRIACVGSGPASLTVATQLAMAGYDVTVFEREAKIGGMMTYGIAPVRLPSEVIEHDVEQIRNLGIKFVLNKEVDLKDVEKFDAVFIGVGLWGENLPELIGVRLNGSFSAVSFLRYLRIKDSNLVKGKRVVVVGGGDVAIDCAVTAKVYGAADVKIVYRRTIEEAPGSMREFRHAIMRGISITTGMAPVVVNGTNKVESIEFEGFANKTDKMILGADIVVFATGQVSGLTSENSVYVKYLSDKRLIKATHGHVNGKYFAGGDAVLGPKTVVEAIKSGKEAAASMIEFLEGKN